MTGSRRLILALMGLFVSLSMVMTMRLTVQAAKSDYLNGLTGGIAALIEPGTTTATEKRSATGRQLRMDSEDSSGKSTLVMANVKNALNLRSSAENGATKVGKLYKDCGGNILEQKEGWTKIQSGNMIGWAKNEYLFFGEDAQKLASDVGRMIATVDTALRVRKAPGADAEVCGLISEGEILEVMDDSDPNWICIDYEGEDAYVSAEYVTLDYQIDVGETMEEIKAREKAEREAKRHVNYGQYTTDADTTLLLAALIQCEAGGESYEGQVAVGAVVMNRVRSGAYPDSIHGVIYASGQFTPAMNGKVNRVYESGKIYESCVKAAEDALSGTSNVGDLTHFRRNNGRDGLVIGNHVFY